MTKPRLALLLPLVLILAAAAFRWAKLSGLVTIPALENFSPWMAIAFTGTLIFSRRVPFLIIPLLLVAIDLAASGFQAVMHVEALAVYGLFALAAWVASRYRGQIGILGSIFGVMGCAIAFYLVTNTVSWFSDPAYAKNISGWLQALTTGIPGLPPTFWFLRNSLLSDLSFSILLLAAHNSEAALRRAPRIPLLSPVAA